LILFGILSVVSPVRADIVRTKDGQTFDGRPLSQTNDCVRLRTKFGDVAVPQADVAKHERTTYAVELKDGTNVVGQILGETKTELTLKSDKETRTIALAKVKEVSVYRPPPPKPDARKLAEWHREAMERMKKKEYAKALEKYEAILDANPADIGALYNAACAHARSGDKAKALERLRKAVEGGFVNFGEIGRDADLESLRGEAAYKALFARKDDYVRQASERAVRTLVENLARRKIDAKPYKAVYDAERNFVYLHAKSDEEFAQVRQGLESFAECFWKTLVDRRPEQPLYIVLLTAADAPKAMPFRGVGGFFRQEDNTLFCCERPASKLLQASIVFHEFTHGLHWADQAAREQDHPIWLMEGLATLFESSRQEDGRLVPLPSYRMAVIQEAVKAKRSIPWAAFMKLDNSQFIRNANVCYAQARCMLFYFHEKKKLTAFYEEYTKDSIYARDKSGLEAIEAAFGKPASEVEQDWKEWALKQQAPSVAFLGVITEERDGRLIVKSVMPESPAISAGIRKSDAIVSVEETPVETKDDLMEAVGHHKAGDELEIRLERGGSPVEVKAKLVDRPEMAVQPPGRSPGKTEPVSCVGIAVGEAGGDVRVREVEKESPAAKVGIEPGWKIRKFGQTNIQTVRDFLAAVKRTKPGQTVELTVRKLDGKDATLKLEIGAVRSEHEE